MPHQFKTEGQLMWLVTAHGFFNIVESDDDREKGLLTVKARRKEDLTALKVIIPDLGDIQTSFVNDYHYRAKGPRKSIEVGMASMVSAIDYPRFKDKAGEVHPDRIPIYVRVWATLCHLQEAQ